MRTTVQSALGQMLALLILAGCSTNIAPLTYTGTPRLGAAPATVSAVYVIDRRVESDPNWYGAIRGGYGNPLKTLRADKPIKTTIQDAVETALAARGVKIDPNAKGASVSVTVTEFEADRVARSEVKVRFDFVVAEASTGRQLYEHETLANPVQGSVMDVGGIFADPKDLQAPVQTTMNRAIDEAIDAPAFQAAIRSQLPG